MRPVFCAALSLVVPLAAIGTAAARDSSGFRAHASAGRRSAAPTTRENLAERRAVRGTALEDEEGSESPELRALRQFEELAFPRHGIPPDLGNRPGPLPPGLEGRWEGSGDIPPGLPNPGKNAPAPAPQPPAGWLSHLQLPDLPIRWAPEVIRYLQFFKDDPKGHAIMATWLRRMGRYRDMIDRQLDEQGLSRDLIYLAMVESGFDPGATSLRRAGGVWQFVPAAARAYGLEVSHWVDARRNPERATEAAAHLLKDLYVRFGSWPLAFAAYNAGYGAVLASIARYNTNDFWKLARHEAGLPWETTLYVPKIMAAAIVGHNLKAFGFADVTPDPPWQFDRVLVSSGISFSSLARAAGTTADAIQELNPEYVAGRVPPDRPSVVLRVPPGSASLFANAAGRLRDAHERVRPWVLRFGETLDDVAKARGCSVRELRRINAVTDAAELRGGTTILVPARAAPAPVPKAVAEDGDHDDPILVAVPDRDFSYPDRERVFYRTRGGDTLAAVAAAFNVSPRDVVTWNNIDPDAKLQPKLILQLFVRKSFDRSHVKLLDPDKLRVVTLGSEEFLELEVAQRGKTRLFYSARAGVSLAKIAKRYGLSPGDLARVNRLSANAELKQGQRIVVYSPTPELHREVHTRTAHRRRKPSMAMKEATNRHREPVRSNNERERHGATARKAATSRSHPAAAQARKGEVRPNRARPSSAERRPARTRR